MIPTVVMLASSHSLSENPKTSWNAPPVTKLKITPFKWKRYYLNVSASQISNTRANPAIKLERLITKCFLGIRIASGKIISAGINARSAKCPTQVTSVNTPIRIRFLIVM